MKKVFLLFLLLSLKNISAQDRVGINTSFPKALFHVDAAGDNPKNATDPITTKQASSDFVITSNGQVGIGTTSPTALSSLDIAVTKGLRIPQITAVQQTDLNTRINQNKSKAEGLLIYNTTAQRIQFYNGTIWVDL